MVCPDGQRRVKSEKRRVERSGCFARSGISAQSVGATSYSASLVKGGGLP